VESERSARRFRQPLAGAALALAALLLGGCAAAPSRDDPFEPLNRAAYQFHDAVDTAVVKPAIKAYIEAVPAPVRTGVSNFFNNIDDLFSAVNDALQGKPEKFSNDLGRVLLNTAFGVGGIFDLASMVGIERGNEDFGQTFGVWGAPQGPYFFIPFLGPTTLRDGTGLAIRFAAGPIGQIHDIPVRNSIYGIGAVDLRAQAEAAGQLVETAALDRYLFIRNAYLQRRRYLVYDGKPPPTEEE
jgi:phospholipid-binding lipoprotein MlaA